MKPPNARERQGPRATLPSGASPRNSLPSLLASWAEEPPGGSGLFRNHHEAILMRQWVRNAAPSRAPGVRGSRKGSTCPQPDWHPQSCGSRNSGRQEMNGDPRGGGLVGPSPGPRRARRLGGSLPSRYPDGRPKPSRGARSGAGLTECSGGPAEARARPLWAPLGSSPPRCHVPPALWLRDRPAPCSGSARPGHHRDGPREARSDPTGQEQSQPAVRRPPSRPGDLGDCAAAP